MSHLLVFHRFRSKLQWLWHRKQGSLCWRVIWILTRLHGYQDKSLQSILKQKRCIIMNSLGMAMEHMDPPIVIRNIFRVAERE